MSTTLAAQQTALLSLLALNTTDLIALYAYSMPANGHLCFKNRTATVRGLRAYRANAQRLAGGALQASHPVLQQLLGGENFQNLAQDFWRAMPPERGDLAQWGGELAAYLKQVPQLEALLAEHPYLPDIARVEWALHVAKTASDAALDTQSFQLLTSHDPAALRLTFSPGCALVRSAYPVVAIMQSHRARIPGDHETTMSDAQDADQTAIANREPQLALIWRQGFRTTLGVAGDASAALVEATLQGQSLSAALHKAFVQAPDFDFSAWLAQSVQSGLLKGVVGDVPSDTHL